MTAIKSALNSAAKGLGYFLMVIVLVVLAKLAFGAYAFLAERVYGLLGLG